jgi:CBS domain containing-hemolysin-like protein
LNVHPGDRVTLMATTPDGSLNAVDGIVAGLADVRIKELNDRYLAGGIGLVARLLQSSDTVSKLVIFLKPGANAKEAATRLVSGFAAGGYTVILHHWQELAVFYGQVKMLYVGIFGFVGAVLVVIVILSAAIVMMMTVTERTREIGTLRALGTACLTLIGVRRQHNVHEQFHTSEELRLIVEESERGGALRSEAGHLLKELFEFGDLTAGEVMVPRVRMVGLPIGASAAEIRRLLEAHRHTRYPVFDGDLDHISGMLHVKDLLKRLIVGESIAVSDVRPMPFVPDTAPLDDVLKTMQRAHAHLAVVIDEHGGTAGLVSIEDLIEEVVGDIDEGVPAEPPLVPAADGSVRAAGTLRLDELGQHFHIELEHEDVDSVSGLVLARLGRPPVVGDVVEYGRLHLKVTATAGRGVREVIATLRAESEERRAGSD